MFEKILGTKRTTAQEDIIESTKFRIVTDAVGRAYENAFEVHGKTASGFVEGDKMAAYILSTVSGPNRNIIRKEAEKRYRKMIA